MDKKIQEKIFKSAINQKKEATLEVDQQTGRKFGSQGPLSDEQINKADQIIKKQNPDLRNKLAHDDPTSPDYVGMADGDVRVDVNSKPVGRVKVDRSLEAQSKKTQAIIDKVLNNELMKKSIKESHEVHCPNCGETLGYNNEIEPDRNGQVYCSNCGQMVYAD